MSDPSRPRERAEPRRALALVEVDGYAVAIRAADAMCDAAAVELAGIARVSPHAVAVLARGDVGSARAAAQAGAGAAGACVRAVDVIPAPHAEVDALVGLHAHHRAPGRVSRRTAWATAARVGT